MKPFKSYSPVAKTALAACLLSFAIASASAVVVAWDLKPGNPKEVAGSALRAQTQSGYDLSVREDTKVAATDTLTELRYKNESSSAGAMAPATYSQFDVRPILGQFVAIPDFGTYQFVSVAAASGPVLPVAFQGSATPLPKMSVFFPIIGLLVAVSSTQILRRRRAAQIALEA